MRGSRTLKTVDFYIGISAIFLLKLFLPIKKILIKKVSKSPKIAILSFGAIGDSLLI